VNRQDFQRLADVRIEEAGILLRQGKPDGAYYLAGYAVECGLKACIAKLTNQHDSPDKTFAQKCFTHAIEELVLLAALKAQRDADAAANASLSKNWATVKDWSESARYENKTVADAQALYDAITDAQAGVLPWLKQRW
jgi:HEPN domain-containing protein